MGHTKKQKIAFLKAIKAEAKAARGTKRTSQTSYMMTCPPWKYLFSPHGILKPEV